MSFLHPEILYYILPPFLILFVFLLTQKETQEHFFSDEVIKKLRVSADTMGMRARNILFFLIGFLIIIALAGPIIEDGKVEVKSKSADIMIALDISDSMLAQDLYPNRLGVAKQKALDLLHLAPEERIGVVAFAKNSYLVSPMSFDHKAVGFLLDKLNTQSITEKGTDFLSLLKVVDKTIKSTAKKYLLLLSDGGDKDDFSKEIAYAKEKNIVVFVIGVGTQKGAPIKKEDGSFIQYKGEIIVSKLNENISDFATSTGGVYIESVKSDADIKAMLQEIDAISEQKELKSETIDKFIPLFYYPLALAILLLLIATSSMYKKVQATSPLIMLFVALGILEQNAQAGLLDFMELEKAKSAYEAGDYNTSSAIYSKYAEASKNEQSYYNEANALYKQEKYDDAIKTYEKAFFDDNISEANRYGNIGNAYVKKATLESLEKAVTSYEKSLELNEDKEIRENLEAVKKALEKQKEEQEKQKENKQDKQEQNKEQEQNQEQNNQNKENQEQENQNQQEEKDKDSKDGKKSDEEKENEENSDTKEDQENRSEQNGEEEDSQEEKSEKEKSELDKKEQEKQKLEELKKEQEQEKKEAKEEEMGVTPSDGVENMSDAEEEKWIQKLNEQQNTFMYMLNDTRVNEEQSDEKPW